jgi:hypothetical protein
MGGELTGSGSCSMGGFDISGVEPSASAATMLVTCKSLFKKFETLPVPCQHIFSLMNFIVNNQENFQTNSSIHNINTRNKHHLQKPNANVCFQKRTLYDGIRIYNSLPRSITSLKNEKAKFKVALKRYLNTQSFYSVDEFFMCKNNPQNCVENFYSSCAAKFCIFYILRLIPYPIVTSTHLHIHGM